MLIIRGARDILADDGPLLAQRAAEAGAPGMAVQICTVEDGVWGTHCGLLLPFAEQCSRAVRDAFDEMADFVSQSLALRPMTLDQASSRLL